MIKRTAGATLVMLVGMAGVGRSSPDNGGGTTGARGTIQIDLGATYSLTEFAYLPRQDANPNGLVGHYELYLATDTSTWGPTCASARSPRSRASSTPPWPS